MNDVTLAIFSGSVVGAVGAIFMLVRMLLANVRKLEDDLRTQRAIVDRIAQEVLIDGGHRPRSVTGGFTDDRQPLPRATATIHPPVFDTRGGR